MSMNHRRDAYATRAWRQVVTPHEDIRRGRFDASVCPLCQRAGKTGQGGAGQYRPP